ncbi:MAG: metal-dependent transcriptional regulator [Bacteriovoracaceae bacterium]|nr:metal-dependent transcriptional regulator [Bacteriovoracaceae bacterium]
MSDKNKITHTHDNDLTHSMVHYLLAIHKLKETKGYARVTDIANYLGLTKGSVSIALINLKKRKLIVEDENKFFTLSESGHHEVHSILSNRTLLYYFFHDFLEVEEETAHKDSCLMEHLMSEQSRLKLFEFMKGLNRNKTFDWSTFKTLEEFMDAQKGDQYLE